MKLKNKMAIMIVAFLIVNSGFASEGMISVASDYSVSETTDRLIHIINQKGLRLFARINHTNNADKVSLKLKPTEVIIFGNPKVGTPLMQCAPSVAIDLPQKALIWQDEEAKVWFSYNDPVYLAKRHNVEGCDQLIAKISHVLSKLSKAATKRK